MKFDMKKLIIIGGVILATIFVLVGSLIMVGENAKGKKAAKNAMSTVNEYLGKMESGDYKGAYEYLAKSSKEWLSVSEFSKFAEVYTMENKVSFEVNIEKQKSITEKMDKQMKVFIKSGLKSKDPNIKTMAGTLNGKEFVYLPIKRSYVSVAAGKKTTLSDEMVIALVQSENSYKVYLEMQTFESLRSECFLSKAHSLTVQAMENVNDEAVVNENIPLINKCIEYAKSIKNDYYYKNKVGVRVNIFEAYVKLLKKEYEKAVLKMEEAKTLAQDLKDIIKVKEILSEIYISQGSYSLAVEVLKEAIELDPKNDTLRVSYRSVKRLMFDKVESSLSRGWNQLLSAISDSSEEGKKERNRLLKHIAMPDADVVIAVNEDLPDGYFLKGSIYYCLGELSEAKKYLELALSKTSLEDVVFKTEIAQTLGLAKVKSNKMIDLVSYLDMKPGQLRSLEIRESKINGILDTM